MDKRDPPNYPKLVRSVCLSSKHGVLLDRFLHEFRETTFGENLPFRKLGFPTVEAYLRTIPDVVRLVNGPGGIVCRAVADETTQHLQNLIDKQRSAKKSKQPARIPRRSQRHPPPFNGGYNRGGHNNPRGRQPYQQPYQAPHHPPPQRQSHPAYNQNRDTQYSRPAYNQNRDNTQNSRPAYNQNRDNAQNSRPASNHYRDNTQNSRPAYYNQNKDNAQNRKPLVEQNGKQGHGVSHSQDQTRKGYKGRHHSGGDQPKEMYQVPPRFRRIAQERREDVFIKSEDNLESTEHNSEPTEHNSEPTEHNSEPTEHTGNQEEKMERVSELLKQKRTGIYEGDLPKLYKDKFQEPLMDDLVEKMVNLNMCTRENIMDRAILYPKLSINFKPSNKPNTSPVKRSVSMTTTPVTYHVAPTQLPELIFPEEDVMEVLVSLVYDTSYFYCYIVGEDYSDKLAELEEQMSEFYEGDALLLVDAPLVSHYYAAKSGRDWLRARVESIEDNQALCQFVDHGDKEEVSLEDIRHLPKRFTYLPEQAIVCRLANSPMLPSSDKLVLTFCRLALSRIVTAEILRRDDPMSLILYSEERNINDMLLNLSLLPNFQ